LKEITFLSKDLIKLSNFCEKKSVIGLKWHSFVIINLYILLLSLMNNVNIYGIIYNITLLRII